MFKIIRCGIGFELVILISPPGAGPDTPDAKYYRYASWQIGDHRPGVFNEIIPKMAMTYFSGIADGLGFETPPANVFPTLDDALLYVEEKNKEWCLEKLKTIGIKPDWDK